MKYNLSILNVAGITFALALAAAVVFDLGYRGLHRFPAEVERVLPAESDLERGRQAIVHYGCGACHVIPNVRAAKGRVGPRLEHFWEQMYLAGVVKNTPENLIHWLQDPPAVNPLTAMPNLDVTAEDARDIAAYLYSVP